jgi:hypothetical protein
MFDCVRVHAIAIIIQWFSGCSCSCYEKIFSFNNFSRIFGFCWVGKWRFLSATFHAAFVVRLSHVSLHFTKAPVLLMCSLKFAFRVWLLWGCVWVWVGVVDVCIKCIKFWGELIVNLSFEGEVMSCQWHLSSQKLVNLLITQHPLPVNSYCITKAYHKNACLYCTTRQHVFDLNSPSMTHFSFFTNNFDLPGKIPPWTKTIHNVVLKSARRYSQKGSGNSHNTPNWVSHFSPLRT